MTLLSELAACVIKARPEKKRKFDELPERRRRWVIGRGIMHIAHLIDVQHEEYCQTRRRHQKS